MSPERVVERTRLPKSTIDRIAPPILQENAERAAIREAEHAVKREQQKILKEKYPCPLCHKGYGIADGGVLTAFLDGSVCRIGTDADAASKGGAFFRPYYAHCSNKRCVAQLIFPRDSREDAVTFSPPVEAGENVTPDAFDTTLMCPKCGSRGVFRKAVHPTNHSKESWCCWWRVGCPKCGARTVNSFPTQEQAQAAFESDDLLRESKTERGNA